MNLLLLIAALSCCSWSIATASDIICPGRNTTCNPLSTCCPLRTGGYGCCPMPHAYCCADRQHCCRNGYHCAGNKCIPNFMERTPLLVNDKIVCPDQTSTCPQGTTCCLISQSFYGCCPLPEAVCCSDGQHCCPSGTSCDLAHETCNTPVNQWNGVPAIKMNRNAINSTVGTQCDDSYWCPDTFNCSKPPGHGWNCIHAVPKSQQWVKQIAASPLISTPDINAVICPDGSSQCPDGSTCCKLSGGDWGCCPLPQATCCDDQIHCCPHGSECQSGRCLQQGRSVPWLTKFKSTPVPQNEI